MQRFISFLKEICKLVHMKAIICNPIDINPECNSQPASNKPNETHTMPIKSKIYYERAVSI